MDAHFILDTLKQVDLMSKRQELFWTRCAQFCFVVFLAGLALGCAPAIDCLTAAEDATMGSCLAQHPPQEQRSMIALCVVAILLGGLAMIGRRFNKPLPNPESKNIDKIIERQRQGMPSGKHIINTRPPEIEISAIDVSQDLNIYSGEDEAAQERSRKGHETLMDMVAVKVESIEERAELSRVQRVTVEGFYCPRRLVGKPLLYVNPRHGAATDVVSDEDHGHIESPFRTIGAALLHAKTIVEQESLAVQVRVMPGVYNEAIEISDMVSVLNHMIPGEGGIEDHLNWLKAQDTTAHLERVTLSVPKDVPVGVIFGPGQRQGMYGIHIVSQEGAKQVGVGNERSNALKIRSCVITGFKMGGIQLSKSGGELPGDEVSIEGCLLTHNESAKGGALAIRDALVTVHGCVLEDNQALSGGAIYALEPRGTLHITSTRMFKNRARAAQINKSHPEEVTLASWYDMEGLGGALVVEDGYIKMALCQLIANGASNAGGAVALLSSRAIFQGTTEHAMMVHQNRARVGGAIFCVGLAGERTTIKASHVNFEENMGQSLGGAWALVASSIAQARHCSFSANACRGDKSLGGAVGCIYGADFMGGDLVFQDNACVGNGAAIGARNASVRLRTQTVIQRNISEKGRAGGIFFETTSGEHISEMIAHGEIQVPLMLALHEVRMEDNTSHQQPSSLLAGNLVRSPTLAIDLEIGADLDIKDGDQDGESMAVFWCGQPKMTFSTLLPGRYMLE